MPSARAGFILLGFFALWNHDTAAATFEPGPSAITKEEAAIGADPAAGIEHALVIESNIERNDRMGTGYQKSVHLRAKILSNTGRELADVEIPMSKSGKLKRWWGRTILPDGTVLELPQSELRRQSEVRGESISVDAVKATLPGVVPGAVIDYGYEFVDESFPWVETIELQQSWPVRSLTYKWLPSTYLQAVHRPKRLQDYDVDIDVKRETIVVTAHDMPPMLHEPFMPPPDETRAQLVLYYVPPDMDYEKFWEEAGRNIEKSVKRFLSRDKPLRDVVTGLNIAAEAPFEDRLQVVYDWVQQNIRRQGGYSIEELEQRADEDDGQSEDDRFGARAVLERGEGSVFEVAATTVGLARLVGAEAYLVYAPDRTQRFWDQGLRTLYAFDHILVAARPAGPSEAGWKLIDPGSGLPFGHVPWWTTAVQGMLATAQGGNPIPIPPTDARESVMEVKAIVTFDENFEVERATWSQRGKGQAGFDARRWLRSVTPEERDERTESLCGGSDGTVQVARAEAPDLDSFGADYRLVCEIELPLAVPATVDEMRISVHGPWAAPPPDLGADAERRHPVVFRFPRIDYAETRLYPAAGFTLGPAPEPVKIESPVGRFVLQVDVDKETDAFVVHRLLALTAVVVKPQDFPELRRFFDAIRLADRATVTFLRSDES